MSGDVEPGGDRQVPAQPRVLPGQDLPRAAEMELHRAEVELHPGDVIAAVPVDPPEPARPDPVQTIYGTVVGASTAARRPIVPAYLRNRAEAQRLAAWAARYSAHVALYHLTRAPLYALRLAFRAPRGVRVALAALHRWVWDAEGAPLRRDAVHRQDPAEYRNLTKIRDRRVRQRGMVAAASALPVLVVAVVVWTRAPGWVFWPAVVVAVAVLGVVGTPADRRVLDVVTVSPSAPPRLDAVSVTRALRSLGISAMNAKDAAITFPAPITRDGPGWRADVDLPYGVTPQDVMEKRRELASGLRRPLGCVWPEPARDDHAGRLVLWVGDRDLAKTKQEAWPLARTGRADLFTPVPFGTDQRGRVVAVTLMFASMIVGSIPRMGKTFSVRLLLLAAALDVRAQLHLYDLKGTGDFGALEPVAHAYRAGDDDDDIEYAVADLRALRAEMRRRTKVIRGLPRALCPESKVTPELANRRELGLWPIVAAADECQRWFEHAKYGKELEEICEDLVRRGPATGITLILATQRPDAKSLPTGISGNAVLRFCLKVMGHTENDMVLGTSAHKNGVKATIFTRRDLGIGYLAGEGDDPQITRTYYVDNPTAEAIVARAHALREAAGTLSGHALGDDQDLHDTGPAFDLVADVLSVLEAQGNPEPRSGRGRGRGPWLWSAAAVGALEVLRPDVYSGWTADVLGAALKARGVETAQMNRADSDGERRNLQGVDRAALDAAQAALPSGPP